MIYTVTLNPSLDYLLTLDSLSLGALNRSNSDHFLAGGKGINVSQVLTTLGVPSSALGFTGGFTGREVERLLQQAGISTDFISVEGETRVNVKLRAAEETEVNAAGPIIDSLRFEKLKAQVKNLGKHDVLVLSGSIPSSLPEDTYEQFARLCKKSGIRFVVDAEGTSLLKTLPYRPFLVKPNHHELGEMVGAEVRSLQDAVEHAKSLVELGAEQVIVSLAGEGAVYVNESLSLIANAPKGVVRGSVGAGDSMVAGFLAALEQDKPIEHAFKMSIASGSATAFSDRLCTQQQVDALLSQVVVTSFEGGNEQ
ncbi:1-phosphofructokinase [Sporosarcina gallistercoris]|uniref:Tagatose-6-phosphate kinase n=1 Tax=Sporosarcina gallistercoris TaxID=2762245 RepID=A0ABR8PIV4_9BACL|nr:1-phosphofructokinase [Sporosarcina gallistercoris]MBD7908092.1 1-phosphofructokinase [Sporosarcina gallistercoris]